MLPTRLSGDVSIGVYLIVVRYLESVLDCLDE